MGTPTPGCSISPAEQQILYSRGPSSAAGTGRSARTCAPPRTVCPPPAPAPAHDVSASRSTSIGIAGTRDRRGLDRADHPIPVQALRLAVDNPRCGEDRCRSGTWLHVLVERTDRSDLVGIIIRSDRSIRSTGRRRWYPETVYLQPHQESMVWCAASAWPGHGCRPATGAHEGGGARGGRGGGGPVEQGARARAAGPGGGAAGGICAPSQLRVHRPALARS